MFPSKIESLPKKWWKFAIADPKFPLTDPNVELSDRKIDFAEGNDETLDRKVEDTFLNLE